MMPFIHAGKAVFQVEYQGDLGVVLPGRAGAGVLDAEEAPGARSLARRLFGHRPLTSFPTPPYGGADAPAVVVMVSVLTLTSCLGEPVNVSKGVA